ncbi:MAG: hypothetical protein AAF353_21125 [Pseudomonadota bacterium]
MILAVVLADPMQFDISTVRPSYSPWFTEPSINRFLDRVIDFSAHYHFHDNQDNPAGSVKRQGGKSLWKAHYDIYNHDEVIATIQEENAWVKLGDAVFGQIPVLGALSGYLFNPAYLVSRPDGTVVMKIKKQPAFFEGRFIVEEMADVNDAEKICMILSILMMVLLERSRG